MPISKTKRQVVQRFLQEKQTGAQSWLCCSQSFETLSDIGRHVNVVHSTDMEQLEQNELDRLENLKQHKENLAKLKGRRGEKVQRKDNDNAKQSTYQV